MILYCESPPIRGPPPAAGIVEGERSEFNLHAISPSASRGHCKLIPGRSFRDRPLRALLAFAFSQSWVVPACQSPHLGTQSFSYCVLPSSFASGEEVERWGSLLWAQMQGKKAQWLKWEGVLLVSEGRPAQGDVGKSGLRQ